MLGIGGMVVHGVPGAAPRERVGKRERAFLQQTIADPRFPIYENQTRRSNGKLPGAPVFVATVESFICTTGSCGKKYKTLRGLKRHEGAKHQGVVCTDPRTTWY